MKQSIIRMSLALLASVFTFSAPSLFADGHSHEHTEMEESMDKLNDAFRNLRKAIRRPDPAQKSTYLGYIDIVLKEAKLSKELVPMRYAGMGEEEKAEAMKSFAADMDIFIKTIEDLHAAVSEGDFDAANEAINAMRKQKSTGHKAHKPEEK